MIQIWTFNSDNIEIGQPKPTPVGKSTSDPFDTDFDREKSARADAREVSGSLCCNKFCKTFKNMSICLMSFYFSKT